MRKPSTMTSKTDPRQPMTPRAWIDVLPELAQGARPGQINLVGCEWVTSFLERHRIDARQVESWGESVGTVFLPASAVATPGAAQDVARSLSGRARVVLCGTPTLSSWLNTPGLVPGTIVAALPGDPETDPAGWLGTCGKIVSGRFFSVRPYLAAGAELSYLVLRSGSERHTVLEAAEDTLHRAGLAGRALQAQVEAIEELLLRALGAAANALGTGSAPEDLDETILPFGCEIRVSIGIDEGHIAISASDLYSHALTTRESVAEAVRAIYEGRRIDGAKDIGLVKAAKAANHFVVNHATDRVCEVISVIERPSGGSRQPRRGQPLSFGLFMD